MIEQITCFENFIQSYHNTQKGKAKHKASAFWFSQNCFHNLKLLQKQILEGTYVPSGYFSFEVLEPKRRLIYAPYYRDKIVQHLLNNVLRDHFEKKFIFHSYSCIRGKGHQRAVKAIQKYQSRFQGGYFIKMDIYKFFYSIDHQILKSILFKTIKCPHTLHLLFLLIDSSPTKGVGLPLGNLSSQLLANVYLNELDQFAKRGLGIKGYVRYADDIFVFVANKQAAQIVQQKLINFCIDKLKLSVATSKTYIHPARCYVSALGFKIKPSHIILLSANKRRIIRRCKSLVKKDIDFVNKSLTSWFSFAIISCCFHFVQSLCVRFGLVVRENKLQVSSI